ncbi:hypothetical protein [Priestia abyssalis]|nr:hypothetical protein [Priestia abyssalis]
MEKRPLDKPFNKPSLNKPSLTIKPNQQNSADKPSMTIRPAGGGVTPKK